MATRTFPEIASQVDYNLNSFAVKSMEEFVIAGKPVLIWSKKDVDTEMEQAALDRRDANFAEKTLKSFSLMERDFDYGINFQNTLITGNVFFADADVNGSINLANAAIDGSFFQSGKTHRRSVDGKSVGRANDKFVRNQHYRINLDAANKGQRSL